MGSYKHKSFTGSRRKSSKYYSPTAGRGNLARDAIGMKGYSRFAAEGKGLSDVGYASYVTERAGRGLGTVIEHPASYLMGMAKLGTPVDWAGKPGYVGSDLETKVKQAAAASVPGARTTTMGSGAPPPEGIGFKFGSSGLGGGGGVTKRRPKQSAETGDGAGLGTVAVLTGAAYLAWRLFK